MEDGEMLNLAVSFAETEKHKGRTLGLSSAWTRHSVQSLQDAHTESLRGYCSSRTGMPRGVDVVAKAMSSVEATGCREDVTVGELVSIAKVRRA